MPTAAQAGLLTSAPELFSAWFAQGKPGRHRGRALGPPPPPREEAQAAAGALRVAVSPAATTRLTVGRLSRTAQLSPVNPRTLIIPDLSYQAGVNHYPVSNDRYRFREPLAEPGRGLT